ncbi:MAG: acetyl-CoA acyltransferase [Gaiellales bacterium]|jgi:acetyl-CoA acyltransferase|nr:acetyl-CoA acyltransferase [Gaiellales bacterium]
MTTRPVIAGYVRSPFQPARKGELVDVRPDELCGQVVRALVERTGIEGATIEDVTVGCAFPEGEQGMNLGRIAGVLAGLPPSVAGATVNRFCGSSMQAVHTAAGALALGMGEAYIAAGVESMTRVPDGGAGYEPHPGLAESYPQLYLAMGETAEEVADRFGVSRERQEAFAVGSQRKAAEARAAGRLDAEITPVRAGDREVALDGCLRPGTTAEVLATLAPAFRPGGSVTAGTSSPLTDGASACLVTTPRYAARHGLEPLASIRAFAVSGCDPEIMGIGPIEATRKVLARAGLTIGDIDLMELNEAFASQALAVIDALGIDPERVNLDGGAIAIGHPLGATGARITGKAAQLLRRTGGRHAVATQCIGGGQGIAILLESV